MKYFFGLSCLQIVLSNPGFLESFLKLLRNEKRTIKREAAWILSNLTASTPEQIQKLIQVPGLFERVMLMAEFETEEVKFYFKPAC